jgi:hypothetical protein
MSEQDTMTGDRFVEYLKDHPRMMGALAATLTLLTQTGAVAAANHNTIG